MRCPKCRFVSSNKKDICPQCLEDLRPAKAAAGLHVENDTADYQSLLKSLGLANSSSSSKSDPSPTTAPSPVQAAPQPNIEPPQAPEEAYREVISNSFAELDDDALDRLFETVRNSAPHPTLDEAKPDTHTTVSASLRDPIAELANSLEEHITDAEKATSELVTFTPPSTPPQVRPEVLDLSDEDSLNDMLDELLGDETVNVAAVKVPTRAKDVISPLSTDDLEIHFDVEVHHDEETELEETADAQTTQSPSAEAKIAQIKTALASLPPGQPSAVVDTLLQLLADAYGVTKEELSLEQRSPTTEETFPALPSNTATEAAENLTNTSSEFGNYFDSLFDEESAVDLTSPTEPVAIERSTRETSPIADFELAEELFEEQSLTEPAFAIESADEISAEPLFEEAAGLADELEAEISVPSNDQIPESIFAVSDTPAVESQLQEAVTESEEELDSLLEELLHAEECPDDVVSGNLTPDVAAEALTVLEGSEEPLASIQDTIDAIDPVDELAIEALSETHEIPEDEPSLESILEAFTLDACEAQAETSHDASLQESLETPPCDEPSETAPFVETSNASEPDSPTQLDLEAIETAAGADEISDEIAQLLHELERPTLDTSTPNDPPHETNPSRTAASSDFCARTPDANELHSLDTEHVARAFPEIHKALNDLQEQYEQKVKSESNASAPSDQTIGDGSSQAQSDFDISSLFDDFMPDPALLCEEAKSIFEEPNIEPIPQHQETAPTETAPFEAATESSAVGELEIPITPEPKNIESESPPASQPPPPSGKNLDELLRQMMAEEGTDSGMQAGAEEPRIKVEQDSPIETKKSGRNAPSSQSSSPGEIEQLWVDAAEEIRSQPMASVELEIALAEVIAFKPNPKTDMFFDLALEQLVDPKKIRHFKKTLPTSESRTVENKELKETFATYGEAASKVTYGPKRSRGFDAPFEIEELEAPIAFTPAAALWRFGASLVDFAMTIVVATPVWLFLIASSELRERFFLVDIALERDVLPEIGSLGVTFLTVWWGLTIALTFVRGQTVGGKIFRVAVVDNDGHAPSLATVVLRTCAFWTTLCTGGIGLLPAFLSSRKTLHDWLSESRVKRVELPKFDTEPLN